MTNILDFNAARQRKQPVEEDNYMSGVAVCLECKHTWVAVAKLPVIFLECPECSTLKGRFESTCIYPDPHLTCSCGNTLLRVTADFIYCPLDGNKVLVSKNSI